MDIKYSTDPKCSKGFDTTELRNHYLIDNLFAPGEGNFTYSHIDRVIVAGIMPADDTITLNAENELGADYFFERREGGIINIGAHGIVILDGRGITLENSDTLYIGKGTKTVEFVSHDKCNPALFYINSCPAHKEFESVKIGLEDARKVELGNKENLNVRTINQYIYPDVIQSCQLTMGMTRLKQGSVWNTMPCHTHARRMEVYMYFDMRENDRVFHLMGEPGETRHIVVSNRQAVLSTSWSVHSGVGTIYVYMGDVRRKY